MAWRIDRASPGSAESSERNLGDRGTRPGLREVTRAARMDQTSPFVFLSHSGADTDAARELKRRLLESPDARAAGLKVWFDKDDLRPGGQWQPQIEQAIATRRPPSSSMSARRGVMNWVERGQDRALARDYGQGLSLHSGVSPPRGGVERPAALRQAVSGRPRSARRWRRVRRSSSRRSSSRIGTGRKAHRRAVRRPAVDARGGGGPLLRPRRGGQGTRREVAQASHRRDRRRQRHGKVFARRSGLHPDLSRRRAGGPFARRSRRPRLARRHNAAGRRSGGGPAPASPRRRKSSADRRIERASLRRRVAHR